MKNSESSTTGNNVAIITHCNLKKLSPDSSVHFVICNNRIRDSKFMCNFVMQKNVCGIKKLYL